MCGIYAILSSRRPAEPPGEGFFSSLEALLAASRPRPLRRALDREGGTGDLAARLGETGEAAGRWVERGAFLALAADPALRRRLAAAARRLARRIRELETLSEEELPAGQAAHEALNRVLVGARDVAWRLQHDVLGGFESAGDLLEEVTPAALARAHELSLTLRALDRLEVRGRDSAGLALYARFPAAAALERFLDGAPRGRTRRAEVAARGSLELLHRAVLPTGSAGDTLLFTYKVAAEVGELGDNVRFLRRALVGDPLLQELLRDPAVELRGLAHTRWASNGVISEPNCHPVDSTVLRDGRPVAGSEGALVAALNGDVDNYQELLERHVHRPGLTLPPGITTDAKIIPVVVAHHLRRTGGRLAEAFRRAVGELEGSMAIALMAAEHPGEILFAQKGSGQGLFFGAGGESIAAASEMYGVVELTSRYLKAEGERSAGGELFRLRSRPEGVALEVLTGDGPRPAPAGRWRTAEITTRDIHRGDLPHYFLKEIRESVGSVRKTLRGKLAGSGPGARVVLGPETLPPELVAGLREGRLSRIQVIGQGTAAIAARGVAHLLARALERFPRPLEVAAQTATELSAHGLKADMSNTLVIAVSQSGTTTDTNRTVDLVRERGARVLSIVNRRNSDLVYRSHGVLYTSDGRDVEMSVASTKAFYAQNVAGQLLALALAAELGTLEGGEIAAAVAALRRLPQDLEATLALDGTVARLAREHMPRRRHWAVVGSGAAKIAAAEIRIKLSELCYKSIALDFLEDKKHIDLSSEPLVIVCAAGLAEDQVTDAVKEVAIFSAHQAVPLVITDTGEETFAPYAAGIVALPRHDGALCFLPATMAGHLLGYHAARAVDDAAARVRRLRAEVVRLQEQRGFADDAVAEILDELPAAAAEPLRELDALLREGRLEAGLGAAGAVRLSRVLELCLRRLPVDGFRRALPAGRALADALLSTLSEAVAELSRPIDAIRHQAKTVTVGISRGAAKVREGVLAGALRELAIDPAELAQSHRVLLSRFEELVASVPGVTLYHLTGLDPLGRPGEGSRIAVERKTGLSAGLRSRCEEPVPLSGNKWAVAKHHEIYLGYGQSDRRPILILPLLTEGTEGQLVLFHLRLAATRDRELRLKALAARGRFLDRLRAGVTERDRVWDPALLDGVSNETLFLEPPDKVAEELVRAAGEGSRQDAPVTNSVV